MHAVGALEGDDDIDGGGGGVDEVVGGLVGIGDFAGISSFGLYCLLMINDYWMLLVGSWQLVGWGLVDYL